MISPYPIVAAIDFGTHGTGYAWAEVGDEHGPGPRGLDRNTQIREQWDGSRSDYYVKDLSTVLLGPSGEPTAWGHRAMLDWTALARAGRHTNHTYVHGFKMALKPGSTAGAPVLGITGTTIDTPAKAYPLVVGSLRRMYEIVREEVEGSGYLERQIRWCVTIPAIWDEAEKQLMRDAAVEAGMPADHDRLILAREPEAAALYCQIHLARVIAARGESTTAEVTRAGSRFMVVDCGGGTVDITAYRVVATAHADRRRLVEIGKVSGGKLGSEYINQAFVDDILTDRLGGRQVVERIRRERPDALLEIMQIWESGKLSVSATRGPDDELTIDQPVYVTLPRDLDELLTDDIRKSLAARPGGSESRIVVTTEEVRRLFDNVLRDLVELVDVQLAAMRQRDGAPDGPEQVLLVGGLSGAQYLRQRLLSHFGDTVTLVRTTNPVGAVLRGAVLLGYDPELIISRRSRYTYGCNVALPFEPGRDPVAKRLEGQGRVMCNDRFHRFVRIGDTVDTGGTSGPSPFIPLQPTQDSVTFRFFRTLAEDPRYIDDEGCEQIGTLSVELGTAMSLPLTQRLVQVRLGFGGSEISARAVNTHTGAELDTTLRFDSSY
ncbi:Hsp70 family protein [Streptomyces griseoruber]|uniref:Hsp70 family protein n=1 Tax=Streptomyces griseoruber TaxID=1943 RepID=A0A117RD48_9ACTN|nr:hypothetical protein [Streptomyces griseoruber]KUN84208.1 hypothetical protein AQJ64_15715 [Streptomyces griseoruber]